MCNNPDCLYLHELGEQDDSFTKEEMQSGKQSNALPAALAHIHVALLVLRFAPPRGDRRRVDARTSSNYSHQVQTLIVVVCLCCMVGIWS